MKKQEVAKKMEHETDYQRARRQRSEVKKYGVTSAKPKKDLEAQSKKAGFYVHGHKNYGDVYEA